MAVWWARSVSNSVLTGTFRRLTRLMLANAGACPRRKKPSEATMPRRFLPLVIVLFGTLPAAALPRADDLGWTEFRNERFGLALRYPAEVFVAQRSSDSGDGDLFETRDGNGRLLVGALGNTNRFTPRSYQAFIARQSRRCRTARPRFDLPARSQCAGRGQFTNSSFRSEFLTGTHLEKRC